MLGRCGTHPPHSDRQARGHWFEPSIAHHHNLLPITTLVNLLMKSGSGARPENGWTVHPGTPALEIP
jgi:hypothetical protein